MNKLILLVIFYFHCEFAFGQNTNFNVFQIDSIVRRIDSTCISGGITDYIFHKKGHKKKVIGGGADWFYTDSSGKVLLKVIRETTLKSKNFDTYYFYLDSLIYLKTSNRTYIGEQKKINWEGSYYFQNHSLIFKQDSLKLNSNPNFYIETARKFFSIGQIWRRNILNK